MSQHTPGPWYAWEFEGKRGVGKQHGNEADILSVTQEARRSDAEDAANMQLIAAAPDLLEALERITTAYADEMYSERSCEEKDIPEVMTARAAIAKARGDQ